MEKNNTPLLREWIIKETSSEELEMQMEKIIGAFSEFLVAVNPDYFYNKTYMKAFIPLFVEIQKNLKKKFLILQDEILVLLYEDGFNPINVEVWIDEIWIYKKEEIILSNYINEYSAQNTKMKIELKYRDINGFVLADEIDLEKPYKAILKKNINLFKETIKERTNG